ncbi:MAG: hypothetical protein HYX57_01345 [Chloroflexi bacterium]|nr:hypothetical protein [Chloroflexota bacterium]
MTDRHRASLPDPHASHDRILMAALAAGDLHGVEHERAERRRAACPACDALHDDLLAIARSVRILPPPVRPADLDFTVAPRQAAEIDRGRGWRRVLGALGVGNAVARPLALGLTTLGVAGLLLASLPTMSLSFGGGSFLPAPASPTENRQAVPAAGDLTDGPADPGASDGTAVGTAAPTSWVESSPGGGTDTGGIDTAGSGGTSPDAANLPPQGGPGAAGDDGAGGATEITDQPGEASPGPDPLVLLSIGFLAAGIGLIALRRAALRLR